VTVPVSVP